MQKVATILWQRILKHLNYTCLPANHRDFHANIFAVAKKADAQKVMKAILGSAFNNMFEIKSQWFLHLEIYLLQITNVCLHI